MTVVKRVGVLSYGKINGALGVLVGLIIGGLFSLLSLAGAAAGGREGAASMLFGVGAIVIVPIFYGVFAFIAGIIGGALYNLVASTIGGIELELELDQGRGGQWQQGQGGQWQ